MEQRRLFGFVLIITALAGLVFSAVGLFVVWRNRPMVTQSVVDTLVLLDQTIKTTQEGLTTVGQALKTTTVDVTSLQATTSALAEMINVSNSMLDAVTGLTGKDLPKAVSSIQTSLASAQGSALLIDNIMTTLTNVKILNLSAYQPKVPLHVALEEVSTSLNTMKPGLTTITTSLAVGKTNLAVVEVELNKVSSTSTEIITALDSAQTVTDQYKTVTSQLKTKVENAQLKAPGWITTGSYVLTFMFVWFIVAQFALWSWGASLMRGPQVTKQVSAKL